MVKWYGKMVCKVLINPKQLMFDLIPRLSLATPRAPEYSARRPPPAPRPDWLTTISMLYACAYILQLRFLVSGCLLLMPDAEAVMLTC